MKKIIIRFWSRVYSFLLPDHKKEYKFLLVNTEEAKHSLGDVYYNFYQSHIFKSKGEMEQYIDEYVSKHERERFLKFKLLID